MKYILMSLFCLSVMGCATTQSSKTATDVKEAVQKTCTKCGSVKKCNGC